MLTAIADHRSLGYRLVPGPTYSGLAYVLLSHIDSRPFPPRYFPSLAFIYSLHYTHMTRSMLAPNNNDVSARNLLKHFIYSSSSKPATSPLCSLYYRYSSELFTSFCILSFLVIATSIDQTFYPATHYLAAVWLDSRHGLNIKLRIRQPYDTGSLPIQVTRRTTERV
jgi:hypothetical protein